MKPLKRFLAALLVILAVVPSTATASGDPIDNCQDTTIDVCIMGFTQWVPDGL